MKKELGTAMTWTVIHAAWWLLIAAQGCHVSRMFLMNPRLKMLLCSIELLINFIKLLY